MTETEMKAAARRVLEDIFPAADEAALADVIGADFVNHEAPPGFPPGPGSVAYFMQLLHQAFSDQRWTIHRVLADGDTVAVHCNHSGRHTGEFFGMPATGRSFSYPQVHLIRFANGRAVEQWAVRDDASLRRQLTSEAA